MKQSRTVILAAAVLIVICGLSPISAQNRPGFTLAGQTEIGPIRQALNAPSTFQFSSRAGFSDPMDQAPHRDTAGASDDRIVSSILLSALGGVAGTVGAIVYTTELSGAKGWDSIGAFMVSFLVLEPLGVAVGAHVGNKSRGRLGQTILSSYGSLVLGSLVVSVLASDSGGAGILVPIIQIGGTVATEHSTANRKR